MHISLRQIPREQMDSPTRKIISVVSYHLIGDKLGKLKRHLKVSGDSEIYLENEFRFWHRVLKCENQMELRKWRTYSKLVMKVDPLTPEQIAEQQEQYEMMQRGGDLFTIDEKDRIREPEPYESFETFLIETEKEGKAYEEFLSMFDLEMMSNHSAQTQGYVPSAPIKTTYVQARLQKYEEMMRSMISQISDGKAKIPRIIKEMQTQLKFWQMLNDDPQLVINNNDFKNHDDFLRFN